ncbi:hypothetical protein R80B4_02695 [Fibrobacteres bacterium R8-0-B4]
MLISVTIENWMSFREPTTFSMVAGRERRHGERVPHFNKYKMKILPIAAIFGGNASGKSNFFKAMCFAEEFILNGTKPGDLIPIIPFLLDAKSVQQPSRFVFEVMINDVVYEYGFSVIKKRIVEEKLVEVGATHEKILYHRQNGSIVFDKSISKNTDFLNFIFRATRENQLFLTSSVFQNADTFSYVYDWFKNTLKLIAPNSRYVPFEQFYDEKNPLYHFMDEVLPALDTGISHLCIEKIPLENTPMYQSLVTRFQENVKEDTTFEFVPGNNTNMRFAVTRKDGELIARKLVAYHTRADGENIKFEMSQESDGSIRVIDLLPAFIYASSKNANNVYIIDEVDRSLHTLLTRNLIEAYLASCSAESRSQMLLTTHDVSLIDQRILRRDEIWVAERDSTGNSTLIPFNSYKDVRFDKDIRKSYLQGRMGGIPRILLGNTFNTDAVKNEV